MPRLRPAGSTGNRTARQLHPQPHPAIAARRPGRAPHKRPRCAGGTHPAAQCHAFERVLPRGPSISINGSNGPYTNGLIDGLDNHGNILGGIKFPVLPGFTREVAMLANSCAAAYRRTANGIVSYTTPSGSNGFTGEDYGLVRPGRPLDSRSPFPRRDLSGNPVGESVERWQRGFAAGCVLKRDTTFFYANYDDTRDRNTQIVDAPQLGIADTVTGNHQLRRVSLRLDHRLTDGQLASLTGRGLALTAQNVRCRNMSIFQNGLTRRWALLAKSLRDGGMASSSHRSGLERQPAFPARGSARSVRHSAAAKARFKGPDPRRLFGIEVHPYGEVLHN
jgi:hypothetical protein